MADGQLCADRNAVARQLRQIRKLDIDLTGIVSVVCPVSDKLVRRVGRNRPRPCRPDERRQNVALVVQQDRRVERHGIRALRRVHPLRVRLHGQQITARDALELVGGVLQ